MSSNSISGTNTVGQNLEIAQQDGVVSQQEIRDIVAAARENGVTNVEVNAARGWLNRQADHIAHELARTNPGVSEADCRAAANEAFAQNPISGAVSEIERQLRETRHDQGVWTSMRAGFLSVTSDINN